MRPKVNVTALGVLTGALAGVELFLAWAFGCGSSDAIPNCSTTSEVAVWWTLPSLALILSIAALLGDRATDRPGPPRLALLLAAACALGYVVVFTRG